MTSSTDRGPAGGAPAPTTRPGAIRVAHIWGVPVYLTVSWLLFAVVVLFGYGSYLGGDRPQYVKYLLGAGVMVCLLVSVLLHELGHALVARGYGVGVRGITLELLGGYTEMDRDAPTPRSEAAIALAGPGVSFLLAGVAALAIPITDRGTLLGDFALQLTLTNLIVAVFNGLPGLPLDGGRALRAAVWAVTGNTRRADLVAAWAGRVLAVATFGASMALYVQGRYLTFLGVVFMTMVAVTMWTGASAVLRVAEVRRRLPSLHAGRMARPLHLVPGGTPLAEALRQRDASGQERPVLGIADAAGQLVALVNQDAVAAVPVPQRPWVSVDQVARATNAGQRVPAEASGTTLLDAAQANPGRDLLVTVGEDVVGVLPVADLIAALQPRRSG
ncbi:MAG TPA: site-2 protease family protein [Micromonosporaceae bacterium]|nr:site-2 protease family protein [Micromonosporaceae bacterium]